MDRQKNILTTIWLKTQLFLNIEEGVLLERILASRLLQDVGGGVLD